MTLIIKDNNWIEKELSVLKEEQEQTTLLLSKHYLEGKINMLKELYQKDKLKI